MKKVTIAILGYGTVAQGVISVLQENELEIRRRTGCQIVVKSVAKRNWQGVDQQGLNFERKAAKDIVVDPEVDIVLELMGGKEPAKSLIISALNHNKHVITANKALIAECGSELFELAREKGLDLSFEAAVAGGIPIIKVLREAMAGNEVSRVAGIINGTGNYILGEMEHKQRGFEEALADAQKLGYAEADPAFDINGTDAAHKITILASIAFGIELQFDAAYIEGIDQLTIDDIYNAKELGYTIKHLGLAIRRENGVEVRVHPTLVPKEKLIANVSGVMNAVEVKGNAIGNSLYYGPGAGKLPTASAVVADLIDSVRELNLDKHDRLSEFGYKEIHDKKALPVLPQSAFVSAYYLQIWVNDEVGVLAEITQVLASERISIAAIIQKSELKKGSRLPLVVLTERVSEQLMNNALEKLANLSSVVAPIKRIRVENLD